MNKEITISKIYKNQSQRTGQDYYTVVDSNDERYNVFDGTIIRGISFGGIREGATYNVEVQENKGFKHLSAVSLMTDPGPQDTSTQGPTYTTTSNPVEQVADRSPTATVSISSDKDTRIARMSALKSVIGEAGIIGLGDDAIADIIEKAKKLEEYILG